MAAFYHLQSVTRYINCCYNTNLINLLTKTLFFKIINHLFRVIRLHTLNFFTNGFFPDRRIFIFPFNIYPNGYSFIIKEF